jgi:Na+/melibiose symporter-like transporter
VNDETTYLCFGSVVAIIGMLMIFIHVARHRRNLADGSVSEEDISFFSMQYRRRMQTSALTVTLGALIALCGQLEEFEESPVFATTYVIALLVLAFWLVLLALGDAAASRMHSNQALRKHRRARQSLEETLVKMQRSQSESDH